MGSHTALACRSYADMKTGYGRRKSPARSFLRTRVRRRGTRTGRSGQGIFSPMVDEAVVITSAEGELQGGVRVVVGLCCRCGRGCGAEGGVLRHPAILAPAHVTALPSTAMIISALLTRA